MTLEILVGVQNSTVPSATTLLIESVLINSSVMLGIKTPTAAQDGEVSVHAH
jgi:hypothetical protein